MIAGLCDVHCRRCWSSNTTRVNNINVFRIDVPPLRERPEDIPALARHFALKAARRFGTPPRIPTPDDIRLLLDGA